MADPCKDPGLEFIKCVNKSDCIKVDKRPFMECAFEKVPSISSECAGLRDIYVNCVRNQLNHGKEVHPTGRTSCLRLCLGNSRKGSFCCSTCKNTK